MNISRHQLQSNAQPMPMPRHEGFFKVTRYAHLNYGEVSLNDLRRAVVEEAMAIFGESDYHKVRKSYEAIRDNYARTGNTMKFEYFRGMMAQEEIHGDAHLIPLALEWGLETCIEDWDSTFNQWLETPYGPGTLS